MQAHTQRQEDILELLVREGCEVLAVVKGEILDEKRPTATQRVDTQGHGPGERVPQILLHAAGHQGHSVFDALWRFLVELPQRIAVEHLVKTNYRIRQ